VSIQGPVVETQAFTLLSVQGQDFKWLQLPLPGQSWQGQRLLTPEERGRLRMPQDFRVALDAELQPGTTLVVTNDSMQASGGGKPMTVIEATS
jgi:hypothetical protein